VTQREERRAERAAAAGFGVTVLACGGLAYVYLQGGQAQLEGLLLAVAFAGVAYGFVTWGQKLMPQGPVSEDRHHLPSTEPERERFEADLERGGVLTRRRLLVRALGAAVVALGGVALFPIRSLGPRPGTSLAHTPWRRGMRLVTEDGRPVRAADVPRGGLVTVFPEGHAGSADGQAVLVRVEDPGRIRHRPGRDDWSPHGYIAYSKVCTHAGCPVGLYQAETHQLLCPCHQSTFDVLDGARPVFGPAAAALPQLPLRLDPDGYLRARGDFPEPVGPAYWHRA